MSPLFATYLFTDLVVELPPPPVAVIVATPPEIVAARLVPKLIVCAVPTTDVLD